MEVLLCDLTEEFILLDVSLDDIMHTHKGLKKPLLACNWMSYVHAVCKPQSYANNTFIYLMKLVSFFKSLLMPHKKKS